MYCKKCNHKNNDSAKFCVKCGSPLEHSQKKSGLREIRPLIMWVIFLVMLCIAGIITAIVVILNHKSAQKNEPVMSKMTKETEYSVETDEESETEEKTETDMSVQDIDTCSMICGDMSRLQISQNADRNLLSSMANVALQMEYEKDGEGAEKKLYTDLATDDESALVYHILNDFQDSRYPVFQTTESGCFLHISTVKQLLSDFYGRQSAGLSTFSYIHDQKNGYAVFEAGDGDPWYQLENYSIRENSDYYLLTGVCTYEDNGGAKDLVGYAKYLFRKNNDSLLGVTMIYSEFDHRINENLAVSAEASSTLKGQASKTYYASNLVDGNINTCWVEGVSGTGEGETIRLSLDGEQTVYGLVIYNGYLESGYLYSVNGKVTQVTVRAADGTTVRSDLGVVKLDERKEPLEDYDLYSCKNWVNFDQPVYTDTLTITIEKAVPGSLYEDTCISEIKVY